MDTVTRYEWQGNGVILVLLGLFVVTIPLAVVYFVNHLLRVETAVDDAEKLVDYLRAKK